ncbi:MAG: heavy metal translocating P-type ATPase [Schlesneria sp.]
MHSDKMQFKIAGMDCAEEVSVLKKELGPIVGGDGNLSFDVLNEILTVSCCSSEVPPETIQTAVARTGMSAVVWRNVPEPIQKQTFFQRWGRTLLTVISGLLTLAGFATHLVMTQSVQEAIGSEGMGMTHQTPLPVRILYGLGILTGAWFVLPRAFLALRRIQPDMNLLMTISVVGAAAIGDWFEASTVAFLFSVSLLLEKWSVGHARRAVETLLDLTPPMARLLDSHGHQKEVAPDQVSVGSTLLVKPGERFPLDGRVTQGNSYVNQAPMTGESLPIAKSVGDIVFAGTINGDGALEIQSTKTAGTTTLAHLIQMVSEAQSRRSHSEQWVEKFARIYTPVVLALALAIFVVPPILVGGSWHDWFYRSLVLLVIACPCALVISTPVSIVAAIAAAARQGVLIKGGAFIELPGRLKAIAFDKTGTLTHGQPSVVAVVPLNGHSEEELLERVSSLESRSEHPLGKSILTHAQAKNVQIRAVEDYQVVPGKGATARLDGKVFWLGSRRYLDERGQATEELLVNLDTLSQQGVTFVIVGNEHHVCGYVALADTVRPDALNAVQALRDLGIAPIVMLTGDNASTAQVIAKAVGVDEVKADLLPAEKVTSIESLVSEYGSVAMVGDGVNDAPAMARSSLGIAMGAAGSDTALETADIALMSDDLSRLPWLVRHSRRTLDIIRTNIIFALAIKILFVVLTLFGFASLWAAIAADMGASLLVIFNGLRLLNPMIDGPKIDASSGSHRTH